MMFNNFNPISEKVVLDEKPEILRCYIIFYVLEMMRAEMENRLKPEHQMKPSVRKFLKELEEYQNAYNHKFAQAVYDYTVLSVAGELRHFNFETKYNGKPYYYYQVGIPSYNKMANLIRTQRLYQEDFQDKCERDEIYRYCIYEPTSLLKTALYCFDERFFCWSPNYGGDNWYDIAKAGLMFGKVKDSIFLDHCADLQHNSGIYFDKEIGVFSEKFKNEEMKKFLNYKRKAGDTFYLINPYKNFIDSPTLKFYKRFINLIVPYGEFNEKDFDERRLFDLYNNRVDGYTYIDVHRQNDKNTFYLFNLKPIKFGSEILTRKSIKFSDISIFHDMPKYWSK